jgi:hypothetical protein
VSAPVCDRVGTLHLQPGQRVWTRDLAETDFGLPLVEPTHARRHCVVREVRNRLYSRGGMVVWFTDGTKTMPLHGRTAWDLA